MFLNRWQRRLLPFVCSALLCLMLAIACDPSPPASQRPTASPAADASASVLKLLYWQAPTILNPHLSNGFKDSEASRITLEPLASYDAGGNLIPILAADVPTLENGGVVADGRSVTWKLKPGLKWSDGEPFSAADVVFTHQFVTNPEVAAISAATYEIIESVEALDETTVKITFKEPNPAWSNVFVGTEGMVLPRHSFAEYLGAQSREAPANLMPVGTGPYRVVEFKPGDVVIYEPNPNYRGADSLGFSRVELKGGGDAVSAARAVLQTGDVDFAYNLQVEAPILEQLAGAGRGEVVANFGSLMERILINFSDPSADVDGERSHVSRPHPFLTDPAVRRALSLAIDRGAIATQLYGRTGKPTANFLVAPESFSSPNTSYQFDPTAAQQALEDAGWRDTNGDGIRDKNGVPLQLVFQTSVNPLRQKTQEILKQAWESIGFRVELKSIDASIFFDSSPTNPDNTGHFYADLQMYTTGNTNPDPGSYMKTYLCSEIAQKANNWSKDNVSRYCNSAYDALWQQVASELDPEARRQIFIQMNDLLVTDIAVIPLVHRAETAGVGDRLAGVNLTPWDLNTWNIAEWRRK
ncbi:peptide ABC transporter substrate-binding protein [Thermoleptolyngbya sp. PKUAC-SCTB121]|uniref:peptide ABC transporter substrate-binding protein n=1 Tax=Thermoleptolyngbya sp. PKUAC-SCTB121 TaxID=2811482 RepID=UPI0019669E6A|nr:peptide ABC transporter substrate-binding protein [Thermoleptolyngbya sp. PKUAC-SCTB121]